MKAVLALAALALGASAASAIPPDAQAIMSDNPDLARVQQEWGFADAVVTGDLIFLSGAVASLRQGETNLEAPFERTFARMGEILKRAGSSWNDVVEITSYHTDVTTQLPAVVAVKHRYVKAPFPAWTAVGVTRLIPDRGLAEIKVIARKSRGAAAR